MSPAANKEVLRESKRLSIGVGAQDRIVVARNRHRDVTASFAPQGLSEVAGTVQHADNHRSVIQRAIKDHVPTERQAARPRHELVASPPHQRVRGEQLAVLLQSLDELSSIARTIARDEVAYFDKIALGILAEE